LLRESMRSVATPTSPGFEVPVWNLKKRYVAAYIII
jgi:hypothetical protein